MKVKVLQIVWHNKEPVFSLDFDAKGNLATAGADGEIKLWSIKDLGNGDLEAEFLSSLTGDKCETGYKTWNCIRFCPTGQSLAAVGDMGQICIWKPLDPKFNVSCPWRATHCGGYSAEDVADLCWSADGSGFVSASNDMTCMFWEPEAKGGKARLRLEGHRLYVQGVAWDPHHQYIVSQGADRCCRVYSRRQAVPSLKKKLVSKAAIHQLDGLYCSHVINKIMPTALAADLDDQSKGRASVQKGAQHLFYDESLSTFSRRLAWSPDGSILVIPAGIRKSTPANASINVAYVFARGIWNLPFLQLPATKPVVAVRFCPVLFELEDLAPGTNTLPISLPYRMIFAIATRDSVLVYDTQGSTPLFILGGLHLEVITDLAWSADGKTLAMSSYDSYCSIACFKDGELGRPAELESLPEVVRAKLCASTAMQNKHGHRDFEKEQGQQNSPAENPMPADVKQSSHSRSMESPVDAHPGNKLHKFVDSHSQVSVGTGKLVGLKKARRITPTLVQVANSNQEEQGTCQLRNGQDMETKACQESRQEPQAETSAGRQKTTQSSKKMQGLSIAQIAAAAGKCAASEPN